jgi:hypothetical protein
VLAGLFPAGVIDEHAAHGPGRDAHVVGLVLETFPFQAAHLDISLVNQSRGLQGMIRSLVAHVVFCQGAELVVHHGQQRLFRADLAGVQIVQQLCKILLGRHFRQLLPWNSRTRYGPYFSDRYIYQLYMYLSVLS